MSGSLFSRLRNGHVTAPPTQANTRVERRSDTRATLDAEREHLDERDTLRRDKDTLRRIVWVLFVGYLPLFGVLIYLATIPKTEWLERDRDARGEVVAYGPLVPAGPLSDRDRAKAIGHWIEDLYTVLGSRAAQNDLKREVYAMVSDGSPAVAEVNKVYADPATDPDEVGQHSSVQVVVEKIVPHGGTYYDVLWSTTPADKTSGKPTGAPQLWSASVEAHYNDTSDDYYNPSRMYVTKFLPTHAVDPTEAAP